MTILLECFLPCYSCNSKLWLRVSSPLIDHQNWKPSCEDSKIWQSNVTCPCPSPAIIKYIIYTHCSTSNILWVSVVEDFPSIHIHLHILLFILYMSMWGNLEIWDRVSNAYFKDLQLAPKQNSISRDMAFPGTFWWLCQAAQIRGTPPCKISTNKLGQIDSTMFDAVYTCRYYINSSNYAGSTS